MQNNSSENVISLSFGKSQAIGAHDDPVRDLLYEFESPVGEIPEEETSMASSRPDFSMMSEEMLFDYVEHKISSLKENTRRVRYYASEIEVHHDL